LDSCRDNLKGNAGRKKKSAKRGVKKGKDWGENGDKRPACRSGASLWVREGQKRSGNQNMRQKRGPKLVRLLGGKKKLGSNLGTRVKKKKNKPITKGLKKGSKKTKAEKPQGQPPGRRYGPGWSLVRASQFCLGGGKFTKKNSRNYLRRGYVKNSWKNPGVPTTKTERGGGDLRPKPFLMNGRKLQRAPTRRRSPRKRSQRPVKDAAPPDGRRQERKGQHAHR